MKTVWNRFMVQDWASFWGRLGDWLQDFPTRSSTTDKTKKCRKWNLISANAGRAAYCLEIVCIRSGVVCHSKCHLGLRCKNRAALKPLSIAKSKQKTPSLSSHSKPGQVYQTNQVRLSLTQQRILKSLQQLNVLQYLELFITAYVLV